MASPTVNLRLVSAPPQVRRCGHCGQPIPVIAYYCDCPQSRGVIGIHSVAAEPWPIKKRITALHGKPRKAPQ